MDVVDALGADRKHQVVLFQIWSSFLRVPPQKDLGGRRESDSS